MKYLIITFIRRLDEGRIINCHKRTYDLRDSVAKSDAHVDIDKWLKTPNHLVIQEKTP